MCEETNSKTEIQRTQMETTIELDAAKVSGRSEKVPHRISLIRPSQPIDIRRGPTFGQQQRILQRSASAMAPKSTMDAQHQARVIQPRRLASASSSSEEQMPNNDVAYVNHQQQYDQRQSRYSTLDPNSPTSCIEAARSNCLTLENSKAAEHPQCKESMNESAKPERRSMGGGRVAYLYGIYGAANDTVQHGRNSFSDQTMWWQEDCCCFDEDTEEDDDGEELARTPHCLVHSLPTVSDIIGYAKVVRAQRNETLGRLNDVMSQFDALIRSYTIALKNAKQRRDDAGAAAAAPTTVPPPMMD